MMKSQTQKRKERFGRRILVFALALGCMLAGPSAASTQVLMSDSYDWFDVPELGHNDNALGGAIAQVYYQKGCSIAGSQVLLSGNTHWFAPSYNFVDQSIADAGGLVVEFDYSPTAWVGVIVGTDAGTVQAKSQNYIVVNNSYKPTSAVLKGSTPGNFKWTAECYKELANKIGDTTYDQSQTAGETYHATVYLTGSFTAGSQASIALDITGELDGNPGEETVAVAFDEADADGNGDENIYTFTWPDNGLGGVDNYIVIEGNGSNTVDNLLIRLYDPKIGYLGPSGKQVPLTGQRLSWELLGAVSNPTYDVYFGTDYDAVNDSSAGALVAAGQAETQYPLDGELTLTYDTTYYWKVEFANGPADRSAVESFTTEPEVPAIVTHPPTHLRADEGATVQISIVAANAARYKWYKDDVLLTNGGDISGATTDTLQIANVDSSDDGLYKCEASNSSGSDTSEATWFMVRRLVAHWEFENDLTDSVGPWDGTMMEFGLPTAAAYVAGAYTGQAVDFSGVEHYVKISDSGTALNFWPGGLTVSYWMSVPQGGNSKTVNKQDADAQSGFEMGIFNNGHAFINVRGRGYIETSTNVCNGEWHMITGTIDPDDGRMRLYVDGLLEKTSGTYNFLGYLAPTTDLVIGMRQKSLASFDQAYDGALDDVLLYNYPMDGFANGQRYADLSGETVCVEPQRNDFNGDCKVDWRDLAIVAETWLHETNVYPSR